MYKLAAEKAGSTELAKVNAAFDSISLEKGFTGASSMKAGTRHCTLPMLLGEMQADASVKIIKDLGVIDPTGQCG